MKCENNFFIIRNIKVYLSIKILLKILFDLTSFIKRRELKNKLSQSGLIRYRVREIHNIHMGDY